MPASPLYSRLRCIRCSCTSWTVVGQYSPYLRMHVETLGAVVASKIRISNASHPDPVVELFKRTWNIATGQESV